MLASTAAAATVSPKDWANVVGEEDSAVSRSGTFDSSRPAAVTAAGTSFCVHFDRLLLKTVL